MKRPANSLGSALVNSLLLRGINVVADLPATYQSPAPGKEKLVSKLSKSPSFTAPIEPAVAEFGNVDVLVNLVHLSSDPPFSDSSDEDWQSVLRGLLKAAYKSSQAAWPHFKKNGSGKIIHVFLGRGSANANYSALKFALYGLTKTTALEWHKYDISSYLVTSTAPNLLNIKNDTSSSADAPNLHAVVSTIIALGSSKGTFDSGTLYEIAGHSVAKVRWVRSSGALLKPDATFTPSAVLKRWEDILNMSDPTFPFGSVDIVHALADLPKLGENQPAQAISLAGQVAVVTGAGAGLGRAHALQLAKLGASVVVNDLKNAPRAVEEIHASGGKAVAHEGSATDGISIVAKAIEAFGRVDIIINNAGFLRDKTVAKLEERSWDAVVDVHLNGMYQTAKSVWPYFLHQGGGRIVNTASTSGIYGFFGQANYSAAKLGIVGLADALAREGSKHKSS